METGKSILLVEDDVIIALAEKRVLESEGYRVALATTGEQAIRVVQAGEVSVDLVLMDIDLGEGIDGTEAAKRILDIRPLPILFLTSHTEREYVSKVEQITSYGYLVKHTGDLVLIASIKMAFRLAEANARVQEELQQRVRAEEDRKRTESRLKRAELAAKVGNWELDLKTLRITGSEGAARIYGLEGTEFPYEMVKEIPLPRYRPLLDQALADLIQKGKPYEVEFQIRAVDTGEIKDVYSVAFYDPEQRTVFGVIQDITKRKGVERSFQNAEARWRFALEGAGHGVWDRDIPSGKAYYSPQWKRILGYEPEEISDRYEEWESRVHPEDLPTVLKQVEDLFHRRIDVYQCEYRLRHKDGSYRWILGRGKVMEWDPEGKPLRFVGTHTDITPQKQAEEKIKALLEEKELLLRETHHRILNNLNVVRSILSLQVSGASSSEVVASLREAQSRIDAMRVLYEKLFRSTNLTETSIIAYLQALVKDIEQIFSIPKRVRILVEGDSLVLPLKQVVPLGIIVSEVVSNALKYAFPQNREGLVRVQIRGTGGQVELEVRDDGVGFKECLGYPEGELKEKIPPLGERFGKGFGLELVSVLTQQLKGSCLLESRVNSGSRYLFQFPAS